MADKLTDCVYLFNAFLFEIRTQTYMNCKSHSTAIFFIAKYVLCTWAKAYGGRASINFITKSLEIFTFFFYQEMK
ncbi:hypothetical protein MAR_035106 [Mya arenaria]|uniref:Uncharacterized protein n=1 Tax=Mya arenaria TaxID=6604 RepID=A0ABY7ELF0_MYAAR|nr:hypothetical protein MAR_035106 [Mya arenaria]